MKIYIRQTIAIELREVPRMLLDAIIAALTIENPKYQTAQRLGKYTGNMDEYLTYYERRGRYLILPRGFLTTLLVLCEEYGVEWDIEDHTITTDPPVSFNSQIELRDYQEPAVESVIKSEGGVLVAPPGSGKTVMGMEIIARLRQPALWVTHTKELREQAIDRAVRFLQIQRDEIGVFGTGKRIIGDKLTVGLVQTLERDIPDELRNRVGIVILDEAHHCPAKTFMRVISKFPAKFRYGLTATPHREDGLTELMYWVFGDALYSIDREMLGKNGQIILPEVKVVETDFVYSYNDDYTPMVTTLTKNADRNRIIIFHVAAEAKNGHFCLVLSERVEHCHVLCNMLRQMTPDIPMTVLAGKMADGKRLQIVEQIRSKQIQVIFATSKLAEEGLDIPHLDRLFITCPCKSKRKVQQAVGRIMRTAEGKVDAIVYDFVDAKVSLLKKHSNQRNETYRRMRTGDTAEETPSEDDPLLLF